MVNLFFNLTISAAFGETQGEGTSFKDGNIRDCSIVYNDSRTTLSLSHIRSCSFSIIATLCSLSSAGCLVTRSFIPFNAASITTKIQHNSHELPTMNKTRWVAVQLSALGATMRRAERKEVAHLAAL